MENKRMESSARIALGAELAKELSPLGATEPSFSTTASELLAESETLLTSAVKLLSEHEKKADTTFQRAVASNYIETAVTLQRMSTDILQRGIGLHEKTQIDMDSVTSEELVALYSLYETRRVKSLELCLDKDKFKTSNYSSAIRLCLAMLASGEMGSSWALVGDPPTPKLRQLDREILRRSIGQPTPLDKTSW